MAIATMSERQARQSFGFRGQRRKNKYNARKVTYDDHQFDSIAECNRYKELTYMLRTGEIENLILQPRFEILPAFVRGGQKFRKMEYVADFQYKTKASGEIITEDVKSPVTKENSVYKLKKKLLFFHFPHINFKEI